MSDMSFQTNATERLIRLYRIGLLPKETHLYGITVESPEFESLPWYSKANIENGSTKAWGRWFTHDREIVDWYAAENLGEPLRFIDVTPQQATLWLVKNNPEASFFSADHENEYFVPIEIANEAQIVEGYNPPYSKNASVLTHESRMKKAGAGRAYEA